MKLLQVITSMDPRAGGACQGVRNLHSQVVKQGSTMEVVSLDDPNAEYLALDNFPISALGTGSGPWRYHSALLPWLRKNLPRFDAVILNGIWQYPGYALSKTVQQANMPPYFVFPHGMLDPWFQRAPGRRLKAVRNWFHWKIIEHRVICQARAVLFTCAEEMRLARETFRPYRPKAQVNVGFGIAQPPEYHPGMAAAFAGKCPGLDGQPFWLFLGRIHPKKGVDILIKAYSAMCQTRRAEAMSPLPKLVIAGPGLETPYGRQMQRLSADLCPPASVFWPGMFIGESKWGALYQAEAFVLMSHQENFGIAVVEALACGTPVMISNQINIWREIEEDKAGLVAADTLAGARQLLQAWQNLSCQEKGAMKAAAQNSYEKNFRVDVKAQTLLATLQGLTKRPAT